MEVVAQTMPGGPAIDAEVSKVMSQTHANGMAVAVIDHGKVTYVQSYGIRNVKGEPLAKDTVMYGASRTKTVFAYQDTIRGVWATSIYFLLTRSGLGY
jgi:CubicO group peptidase (beta-lactamase class C family)